MRVKRFKRWRWLWGGVAVVLLVFPSTNSPAQYKVFGWENLESGSLPSSLKMRYNANLSNVRVAAYSAPDAPPGLLGGRATSECGQYGLRFDATPEARMLAVANDLTLDRRGLGDSGRALYQADFYLTGQPEKGVNIAVLAVAKPQEGESASSADWRTYRAGILDGNKVYYSYADGTKVKGKPVDYQSVSLSSMNVKVPGWHRFQLIFEGQDKIICAVDGKPTAFSPKIEPTLVQLQAGIMVTVPPEKSWTFYADNLSIQYTKEDLGIPDSPWVKSPDSAGGSAVAAFPGASEPTAGAPNSSAGGGIRWATSPDKAWNQGWASKTPVLVMFYMPRAKACQTLDQILQTDSSAKQTLSQFVAVRVDANQLQGGTLAQKFGIYRVPTFLVLAPNKQAQETGRVTFNASAGWASVSQELQKAYSAAKQASQTTQ